MITENYVTITYVYLKSYNCAQIILFIPMHKTFFQK